MNVRYIHLHVKYLFFCRILMKFEFSWQIFKKYTNVKFHKICPVGAEFHVDGWTDRHDETITFCNSANTPKNCSYLKHSQKMSSGYPLCLESLYEVVCGFQ